MKKTIKNQIEKLELYTMYLKIKLRKIKFKDVIDFFKDLYWIS